MNAREPAMLKLLILGFFYAHRSVLRNQNTVIPNRPSAGGTTPTVTPAVLDDASR
jgi:hypothetical protein